MCRVCDITDCKSRLLPHEKLNCIREMDKMGHGCIMLGDGINDASALAGKLKERKGYKKTDRKIIVVYQSNFHISYFCYDNYNVPSRHFMSCISCISFLGRNCNGSGRKCNGCSGG